MTPGDHRDGSPSPPARGRSGGASAGPEGRRFTRAEHIRRRQDYEAVYERGSRLSGALMTVFFLPNSVGIARLGIAATRKIGAAVGRNRAKRRVREVFRHTRPADALDIVVIPRRELIDAPFERVQREFSGLLTRHRRRVHA